jgi:hypothetical protein
VTTSLGSCTFNFLFTDPKGGRYIGTAGHCILSQAGERSWAPGAGPVASAFDAQGTAAPIGRFVYAVMQDPKDFAVIRLDRAVTANPAMCHFGGPIGLNTDLTNATTTLHHFGNGVGIGNVVPARTEVATSMASPDHVFADGVAVFGDSGSGVVDDAGRAVGVLVTIGGHLGQVSTNGVDGGFIGITRIGPQLARAGRVLGLPLTLVNAR